MLLVIQFQDLAKCPFFPSTDILHTNQPVIITICRYYRYFNEFENLQQKHLWPHRDQPLCAASQHKVSKRTPSWYICRKFRLSSYELYRCVDTIFESNEYIEANEQLQELGELVGRWSHSTSLCSWGNGQEAAGNQVWWRFVSKRRFA